MIRKCFLTLVLSLAALIAGAQIGAGQWKIHPYFVDENVTNCIDVGDKVYYLVSGSLYCYDKASQANSVLDVVGNLNDVNIKQIYYNYDKDYLFIAYNSCNIDIIKNDGTVVNLSAIKDVILPKAKAINDITFANGFTYVAASFGYITIEDESFRVMEVRNFGTDFPSVAQVGEYKIMTFGSVFYYSKASEQIEKLTRHKKIDNPVGKGKIYPIGTSNRFFLTTKTSLYIVDFTVNSDGTLNFTPTLIADDVPASIQKYSGGYVASHFSTNDTQYYTFDSNGNNATQHNGEGVYTSHENGNWWIMGKSGLVHQVNGVMQEWTGASGEWSDGASSCSKWYYH